MKLLALLLACNYSPAFCESLEELPFIEEIEQEIEAPQFDDWEDICIWERCDFG